LSKTQWARCLLGQVKKGGGGRPYYKPDGFWVGGSRVPWTHGTDGTDYSY